LEKIENILKSFSPISLEEMDEVKLMNRMDTKFIYNVNKLPSLLEKANEYYKVLEISGKRIHTYNSIYFDTSDHYMYIAHHNTKLNRYKIRYRKYVDSDKRYLEIKFKNNKERTRKKRIRQELFGEEFDDRNKQFIREYSPFDPDTLEAKLVINFMRFTLVHNDMNERITIDNRLEYDKNGHLTRLPFLTITEVKQSKFATGSDFVRIMKEHRIYPTGMSKYCIGTVLNYKDLKANRFKRKLLMLNKISNDSSYSELFIKN